MDGKSKKIISDWIRSKATEFSEEFDLQSKKNNFDETEQKTKFYKLFDIEDDQYNNSAFQIWNDVETGYTTVTRLKCWVWPLFSDFGRLKSNSVLHHIIVRLDSDDCIKNNSCIQMYFKDGTKTFTKMRDGRPYGLTLRYFKDEVIWVGKVSDGKGEGKCLSLEPEGGSYIFGQVDEKGEHTGEDITYIYPDCRTALIGKFEDTQLIEASLGKVAGIYIEDNWLQIQVEDCGNLETFTYSPSDYDGFISDSPLLRDPFESSFIEIRESRMEGGGEGIFAVRDIPSGSLASIYNGVRYPLTCFLAKDCDTDEEIYERLSYNIHMPQDAEFFLDIPVKFRETSNYCATLGHKVNHSFHPNCEFSTLYHPRFGRVRSVVTTKNVKKGEELFVDYGYDLIRCPEWYRELHKRQIEDSKKI